MTGMLLALVCVLLGSSAPLRAAEVLNLDAELAKPGVKMAVVEFYADWCLPCKKAVPKWNALHEKYGRQGLRFIVIATNEQGLCSNPGWNPDKMICDLDGSLQKKFQVNKLPQAFLYSWQGKPLLSNGYYEQVSKAVEAYFRNAPKVVLYPPVDEDQKPVSDGDGLRERLRGELAKVGKFDLALSEKEPGAGRRLREKAKYDETQACEAGRELGAASLLFFKRYGRGAAQRLALQLFAEGRGCLLAGVEVRVTSAGLDKAVSRLVDRLHDALAGRVGGSSSDADETNDKGRAIVVWRTENKEGLSESFITSLSGVISAEVERSSGLRVVSEGDLARVLEVQEKKQRCSADASNSGSCLTYVAEALRAPRAVTSDLARFGSYWVLNLQLLDVNKVEVLGRVSRRLSGKENVVLDAIPKAVAELFGVSGDSGKTPALAAPANPLALSQAKDKLQRLRQREIEWTTLIEGMTQKLIEREQLFAVLQQFLSDYPEPENPHREHAQSILTQMAQGKDPTAMKMDPKRLRTRTEWFAMRAVGGGYGGGGEASFITLRWEYFVWELLRGGGSGVGPGFRIHRSSEGLGKMWGFSSLVGTAFGYPLHLGVDGRHELRFETGLFGSVIEQTYDYTDDGTDYEDVSDRSWGPHVLIEISYLYHQDNAAFQMGLELLIPTYKSSGIKRPDPVLNGFVGFRL